MVEANLSMSDLREPKRPTIPQILIQATKAFIKAGMAADQLSKAIGEQEKTQQKIGQTGNVTKNHALEKRQRLIKKYKEMKEGRVLEDDEEEEEEVRELGKRRFGVIVIGDRKMYEDDEKDIFSFLTAAPIDFSFTLLNYIEEIIARDDKPHLKRVHQYPKKTHDDRFKTASMWLSYNLIEDLQGLVNICYRFLENGPMGLCWLDLSFNNIIQLNEDAFAQLPNLKIFYLHSNNIMDMTEIAKLRTLPNLISLTVHANPVEEEECYRPAVLYYLPKLKHLDYFAVTPTDRFNACHFGPYCERYWAMRHDELLLEAATLKAQMELSMTAKLMAEEEGELNFEEAQNMGKCKGNI